MNVIRHPNGPRVYVAGRRVHHGLAALIALPFCGRSRALRLVAVTALAHDIRDFPFRDIDNH